MANYNQQYYFNNQMSQQNNYSQLKNKDNSKKIFIAWLSCFLASFVLPFVFGALFATIKLFEINTLNTIGSAMVEIISSFSSLLILASHILIIIGKCQYPKNKTIKTAFIIDMVYLGINILTTILAVIFIAVACGSCMASCPG